MLPTTLVFYIGTSNLRKRRTFSSSSHKIRSLPNSRRSVKTEENRLDLFYFYFYFYFFLIYFSIFLFLEQLGLELIGHAIISVTWWHSHKTDHEIWENLVEDSRNRSCHTTWTPYIGLMDYTWMFRVECTVLSTDYL